MFWNSKKEPTEEEGVLRDLTEGQLSMVAGGVANDHDADDMKWNTKKHHHHHHHHHHHTKKKTWTKTNDHDADDKTTTTSWANTSWSSGGTTYGGTHW